MDFTDYDDDFEAAPEPVKNAAVPDGKYVAKLTGLAMGESKKGDARIEWTFNITEGPKAGLRIWKNDYIPTPGSADPKDVKKRGYIMADVKRVAGDIKFSEFIARLDDFTGGVYNLTVKTNGAYTNVYLNDAVVTDAAPAAPAAPAQSDLPNVPRGAANGAPF